MEKSRLAMGVPGTLSNRPPVPADPAAAAAPGAPADAEKADNNNSRKNATTRQYAYDRAITQIKRSRGRLRKLSVAVVLNNASAANAKAGYTPAELANIEKILTGGLGINAARGDVLAVSSLNFPAPAPVEPWWQERDTIVDASGYALWIVGALLAYLLLARPMLRTVTARMAPALPAPAAGPGAGAAAALPNAAAGSAPAFAAASAAALPGAGGGVAAVVPLLENYDLPPAGSAVDVMVDHLKVLAGKEPERVAEVVKQWVQKKHGRTEQ
jgi:flagellar M-ring protein FliF